MDDPARTIDPVEAVELATGERAALHSLIDELLDISNSVADEDWANLPEDGAKNVDRYLYGKRL